MPRHPDADRPIDTGVIVPEAVRAGVARADALMAQARGEPSEVPVAPPAPQPPGKELFAPTQQVLPPQQPVPEGGPSPQEPPQPNGQPPAPLASAADWEQRYRSMKGRRDAEADQAQRTIADLHARLTTLEQSSRADAPPAPAMNGGIAPEVLAEDEASWGPDMMAAVQRRVDAGIAAAMQRINGEVGSRVANIEQATAAQRQEALDTALDTALPGGNGQPSWRDLNFDPQFNQWLGLRDPLSGAKRLDMLKKAYAEYDAQRVFNFFASFISEAAPAPAGGQEPGATPPAPSGELPPPSNRISLASLAAPGPARPPASATPPAPAQKRTWTNSEIGAFFSAKTRGAYEGTPELRATRDAYEADIFAAQAEGRVAPG